MEQFIDDFDQVTLMVRCFALFSILICMTEILGGILVSKGKIMFQYGNKLLTVCSSILLLLALATSFGEITLVYGLILGLTVLLFYQLLYFKKIDLFFL